MPKLSVKVRKKWRETTTNAAGETVEALREEKVVEQFVLIYKIDRESMRIRDLFELIEAKYKSIFPPPNPPLEIVSSKLGPKEGWEGGILDTNDFVQDAFTEYDTIIVYALQSQAIPASKSFSAPRYGSIVPESSARRAPKRTIHEVIPTTEPIDERPLARAKRNRLNNKQRPVLMEDPQETIAEELQEEEHNQGAAIIADSQTSPRQQNNGSRALPDAGEDGTSTKSESPPPDRNDVHSFPASVHNTPERQVSNLVMKPVTPPSRPTTAQRTPSDETTSHHMPQQDDRFKMPELPARIQTPQTATDVPRVSTAPALSANARQRTYGKKKHREIWDVPSDTESIEESSQTPARRNIINKRTKTPTRPSRSNSDKGSKSPLHKDGSARKSTSTSSHGTGANNITESAQDDLAIQEPELPPHTYKATMSAQRSDLHLENEDAMETDAPAADGDSADSDTSFTKKRKASRGKRARSGSENTEKEKRRKFQAEAAGKRRLEEVAAQEAKAKAQAMADKEREKAEANQRLKESVQAERESIRGLTPPQGRAPQPLTPRIPSSGRKSALRTSSVSSTGSPSNGRNKSTMSRSVSFAEPDADRTTETSSKQRTKSPSKSPTPVPRVSEPKPIKLATPAAKTGKVASHSPAPASEELESKPTETTKPAAKNDTTASRSPAPASGRPGSTPTDAERSTETPKPSSKKKASVMTKGRSNFYANLLALAPPKPSAPAVKQARTPTPANAAGKSLAKSTSVPPAKNTKSPTRRESKQAAVDGANDEEESEEDESDSEEVEEDDESVSEDTADEESGDEEDDEESSEEEDQKATEAPAAPVALRNNSKNDEDDAPEDDGDEAEASVTQSSPAKAARSASSEDNEDESDEEGSDDGSDADEGNNGEDAQVARLTSEGGKSITPVPSQAGSQPRKSPSVLLGGQSTDIDMGSNQKPDEEIAESDSETQSVAEVEQQDGVEVAEEVEQQDVSEKQGSPQATKPANASNEKQPRSTSVTSNKSAMSVLQNGVAKSASVASTRSPAREVHSADEGESDSDTEMESGDGEDDKQEDASKAAVESNEDIETESDDSGDSSSDEDAEDGSTPTNATKKEVDPPESSDDTSDNASDDDENDNATLPAMKKLSSQTNYSPSYDAAMQLQRENTQSMDAYRSTQSQADPRGRGTPTPKNSSQATSKDNNSLPKTSCGARPAPNQFPSFSQLMSENNKPASTTKKSPNPNPAYKNPAKKVSIAPALPSDDDDEVTDSDSESSSDSDDDYKRSKPKANAKDTAKRQTGMYKGLMKLARFPQK